MNNQRKISIKQQKPPPPPHLSKEALIVWESWSKLGDREVARESAAKGTYVDMAQMFLCQRKCTDPQSANAWFKSEILQWALELLSNRQVFKASHVLANIKLDPVAEITKMFMATKQHDFRDFLGGHLDKIGEMNNELRQSWDVAKVMEDHLDTLQLTEVTIDNFTNMTSLEKSEIAAKLYLVCENPVLLPLLEAETLLQAAMTSGDFEFVNTWINIYFTDDEDDAVAIPESKLFLKHLPIDEDLLKTIYKCDNAESVSNTLAAHGIFSPEEALDLVKILKRLAQTESVHLIPSLFFKSRASIDYRSFKSMLFKYCTECELYGVINECLADFELPDDPSVMRLLRSCRQVARNVNDKVALAEHLELLLGLVPSQASQVDRLIRVFILLLNESLSKAVDVNGLDEFRLVKIVQSKIAGSLVTPEVTVYDLLEKHGDVDVSKLYGYRFSDDLKMPHFNLEPLVKKWGYSKEIDYRFFVEQCRPSLAYAKVRESRPRDLEAKINKLAVRHFHRKDVVSSCVAFLQMQGLDTDYLRVEVKAADTIFKNGTLSEAQVSECLADVNKYNTMKLFEQGLCDQFRFDKTADAVDALKSFEVVVKYAKNHSLSLPESLPKKLAEHGMWVEFLMLVQKHGYPQEQVVRLTQYFKNDKLSEHLCHAITHDIQYEHKNVIMRDRDSRNYYLSRIGVRKHRDNDSMTSSVTSQSSFGSTTSSSGLSDFFEFDDPDAKVDLLQLLIKCHNSSDPPKALLQACQCYKYPLFAILATSYEPDSVVTNWLTWLSVMCGIDNVSNFEAISSSGNSVAAFMKVVLEKGYFKTLKQSFHIFLPDNPLNSFLSALVDCNSPSFDLTAVTEKLQCFNKLLRFKRSNSFISELDHDRVYLNNKLWIENTALTLLAGTLQHHFKSLHEKIQFLKVLSDLELEKYFLIELPAFSTLLEILNYLFDEGANVEFTFFKLLDLGTYAQEITAVIDKLVKVEMYDQALKVAVIGGAPTDSALMRKWEKEFSSSDDVNEALSRCNSEFIQYKIMPKSAVLFYKNCPVGVEQERYKILRLAYDWAHRHQLDEVEELETEMWRLFLKYDNIGYSEICCENKLVLYGEMKNELKKTELVDDLVLSESEKSRLDSLINYLLDAGDVFRALRLQKVFDHSNNNLDILKLCLNLVEGLLLPFQLNTEERLLLRKSSGYHRTFSHRRKPLRSTRLSSLSSVSHSPGNLSVGTVIEMETVVQDTLTLIENLIDGLTNGAEIAQTIFMLYRISINIDKKYSAILKSTDPENLLVEALSSGCQNKIEVVYDFIAVYKWNKQKVADFICEQVINAVSNNIRLKTNESKLWDVNMDTDIYVILQLLQDSCSILGNKLYSYANALYKAQTISNDTPNLSEIQQIIELLIRAHDCYTADCNMEGISIILKKCQTMVNLLLTMKDWALIVRLLTGVARYNELNYVFHILRENDQFEYLLRRVNTTVKDNGLKVALLEYLRKYCPDNKKLYEMVALHFTLYSEVAQLWEDESALILGNLIEISKLEMKDRKIDPDTSMFIELTNTDGTQKCLNKAMENYTHACEYHLQGEKLAKAMNAARQAELIALQMSLLKGLPSNGTATCLVNLTNTNIPLVLQKLSFQQALILTEAYDHQTDWAAVLFEQYVINNRVAYLANFLSVYPLTDSLAFDISRRFLSANLTNRCAIHNMKGIIKMISSVHTKYRLASELAFPDLVEELLNGDKLMYLKDTVWKRGYKN